MSTIGVPNIKGSIYNCEVNLKNLTLELRAPVKSQRNDAEGGQGAGKGELGCCKWAGATGL